MSDKYDGADIGSIMYRLDEVVDALQVIARSLDKMAEDVKYIQRDAQETASNTRRLSSGYGS